MEIFFVWIFVASFLGMVACYFATVVTIRKFMPDDWSWRDVQTLESSVLESGIPASVRWRYALFICFFTLAATSIVPLAVMRGELIGIIFAVVVAGGSIYKLFWLWLNYRQVI